METILIHRMGSLGDTIIALPCFHKIAQAFPDARRVVITNFPVSEKAAPLAQVLGDSGLIDGTIGYRMGVRGVRSLWNLLKEIRATKARTLIYIPAPRGRLAILRDYLFFKACGISRFVGLSLGRSDEKYRVDPATGKLEREAERIARELEQLGPINLNDLGMWDLLLTPQETVAAERFLRPIKGSRFVAINVGGKLAVQNWGDANWAQVFSTISAENPGLAAVFVGSAGESARCEQLGKVWCGPVLNGAGLLTPRECAAVLGRAEIFIGHDSGPMHLAASRGTRCVTVFGSNNLPNRWHPMGAGHRSIHRLEGIELIQVPEVLEMIRELLAMPGTPDQASPQTSNVR